MGSLGLFGVIIMGWTDWCMGPGMYASGATKEETIPLSTAGKIVGELSRALNMVTRTKPYTDLLSVETVMALNRYPLGGLGSEWNPNADGVVRGFALSSSGKVLYVGGSFHHIGGETRHYIAALDLATGKALSWNPNYFYDWSGWVNSIMVFNSGAGDVIIVGGKFESFGGPIRYSLAAVDNAETGYGVILPWDPRVEIDYEVHHGIPGEIRALGHAYDATLGAMILVGGEFIRINEADRYGIAALNPNDIHGEAFDWGIWPSPPSSIVMVRVIRAKANTVYVGGEFGQMVGAFRSCLAALDTGTGQPTDWDPLAGGPVYDMLLGETCLYAVGAFTTMGSKTRLKAAAVSLTSPAEVLSWNPKVTGTVAVSVWSICQGGSMIILSGNFTKVGGHTRERLASVDMESGDVYGWSPGLNSYALTMLVRSGILYLGGNFSTIKDEVRHYLGAILLDDLHTNLLALRGGIADLFDYAHSRVWKDDNKTDNWDALAELLAAGSYGGNWLPLRPQDSRIYTQIRECFDKIRGLSWDILDYTTWLTHHLESGIETQEDSGWALALAASKASALTNCNLYEPEPGTFAYFEHTGNRIVQGTVISEPMYPTTIAEIYAPGHGLVGGETICVCWEWFSAGRRGGVWVTYVYEDTFMVDGGYGELFLGDRGPYGVWVIIPDKYRCKAGMLSTDGEPAIKWDYNLMRAKESLGQFVVRFQLLDETGGNFQFGYIGNIAFYSDGPVPDLILDGAGDPMNYKIQIYAHNLYEDCSPFISNQPANPPIHGPTVGWRSYKQAPIWIDAVPDDWFWR
jgi:hypothetical protein